MEHGNVVNGCSELNLILPISIVAHRIAPTMQQRSDFQNTHEINIHGCDDSVFLTIDFPIRVILPKHKVRSVGSKSVLDNLVKSSQEINEMPQRFKCVDIIYPQTVSIFDQETETEINLDIERDQERFEFLDNLDVNDLMGIEFPITYLLVDGSRYEANNFEKLELVLQNFKESCLKGEGNDDIDGGGRRG